jgi:Tol biopolymer transport system component
MAAGLSSAPTLAGASMPGVILGTAAYMSPEQAKGKETDRTSDIWSFGCVLYEMLTRRKAFEGQTVSEILAEVLKSEPDWQRLPADTPEAIRRLLVRSLRKDAKTRLRDIGDARIEIEEAQSSAVPTVGAVSHRALFLKKERLVWIAVVAILAVLAGAAAVQSINKSAPLPETRVDIVTAPTYFANSFELSPDGRKIVYVAEAVNGEQLWVRSLDSGPAKVLPGTNSDHIGPFWSPDNRSVGFFADNKLKVVDTETGLIRILTNSPNARGGTWNQKDVILFARFSPGPIYRISASGGKPEPVTKAEEGVFHQFPQFLPDGRHFLFYIQGNVEKQGVYVSSLDAGDGSKPVRLFDADSAAVYSSSGHLLFLQKGRLTAQPFDAKRLSLTGNAFTVAEDIATSLGRAAVSASPAGPIVYRVSEPEPTGTKPHFAWFDRTGREVAPFDVPLPPNVHWYLGVDSRSFAQEQQVKGASDIWRVDLVRGVQNQITTNPAYDMFPVLSSNGQRIVFGSNRKGSTYDLYLSSVDRINGETLLLESKENKIATDWSADGRFLLYRNFSGDTGYDVWALPLDENGKPGEPIAVARTAADERDGQFSPDGKWVAYQSNENGSFEIYVQPFPGPGARYLVSRGGGSQVRWNRNGKELFYVALDGRLMSVPIRLDAGGFEAGAPVPLFSTTMRGAEIQSGNRQQYAVSADGQRILMRADTPEPNTRPLTLILNWKPKP